MFNNLPVNEKQAFFSLLDEYYEARPHLLPSNQEEQPYSIPAVNASPPPAIAPRRANPPIPAARKPVVASTPSAKVPVAPAGLTSGKSFGSLKTNSSSAAIGSIMKGSKKPQDQVSPGEAISGLKAMNRAANRLNLGPDQGRMAPPPPPPPPVASHSDNLGQAEVIYEYKGTEAEDISVRQYEIINLVEKIDENWWKAEASDGSGRSGLVPATYIKVL